MKAFVVDRYGTADHVRAGEVPDPALREDDVLVQVHAAGVNLLDSKIRNGEFKTFLRYRLPLVLGHGVSSIESSPSHRPKKRWPVSKQDAPRARSSFRCGEQDDGLRASRTASVRSSPRRVR